MAAPSAVSLAAPRSDAVHLESRHAAAFPAELHVDQVDRLAAGAVPVGIGPIAQLLQGLALGLQLHHLELEQIPLPVEQHRHVEPFRRLASALKEHLGGAVRGVLDGRNNAYVEAMNGLLQQTKTAARGSHNVENFIAMACLRMSRPEHLPQNPLVPAIPRHYERYLHVF